MPFCEKCGSPKSATDRRQEELEEELEEKRREADKPNHALTRRLNAKELVEEYQAACADIRAGFALVVRAQERLDSAFPPTPMRVREVSIRHPSDRCPRWDDPSEVIDYVTNQAWWMVAERLDVFSALSPVKALDMRRMLDKGEMGELTVEHIASMAKSVRGQLSTLIEQCVVEAYDFLRPRDDSGGQGNARFKSNSPYRVGGRVVLAGVVDVSFGFWSLHYRYEPELKALERVFMMLDGAGTTTPETGSPFVNGIKSLKGNRGGTFSTDYFRVKAWKNGNVHIYFLRKDLLALFNKAAGDHLLPPGATRE